VRLIPVDSKLKNKLTERISSDSIYMHISPAINTTHETEYMGLADKGDAGNVPKNGVEY